MFFCLLYAPSLYISLIVVVHKATQESQQNPKILNKVQSLNKEVVLLICFKATNFSLWCISCNHSYPPTHIYNCTIFPFLKHKHCEVPDGLTLRKKVDGYFFWSKEMIGLFLHPEEQQSPCAFNNKTLTLYVWVIIPHGTLYDLAL